MVKIQHREYYAKDDTMTIIPDELLDINRTSRRKNHIIEIRGSYQLKRFEWFVYGYENRLIDCGVADCETDAWRKVNEIINK